jgi:hypothetical protein
LDQAAQSDIADVDFASGGLEHLMRTVFGLVAMVAALLAACGGDAGRTPITAASSDESACVRGFSQPAGTVAVDFSVDDRDNRVYAPGDLKWRGSFSFDPATRLLTFDPNWAAAPEAWPTLYDDGPWTRGGHEPIGARAGDHVWGVTVFVAPPALGADLYEYGLIDLAYQTALGQGWIWRGPNGVFTIEAGATLPVRAAGLVFERFGNDNLLLTLDTTKLAQFEGWTWDTTTVTVKSSLWGWSDLAMTDDGHGLRTFVLSDFAGKHALLFHNGLLNPGDQLEFVFTIGGVEYRNWWVDYLVLADGVSAATGNRGTHHLLPATIWWAWNGNTAITVPERSHAGGWR